MSDIDSDAEGGSISMIEIDDDNQPDCSTPTRQGYQPHQLQQLLKKSIGSKHYIVTKNSSLLIKSDVWKVFGLPAKVRSDGRGHDVISNFVSCFECFKTLPYEGSTKYMIKHKCSSTSTIRAEPGASLGGLDKYFSKKADIHKQDKEKIRDKLVIWTCSSIRPFTIVEDPGFLDVLKEGIRIGMYKSFFQSMI